MVVRCGTDNFCRSNARWNLVRIYDPQWLACIGEPDQMEPTVDVFQACVVACLTHAEYWSHLRNVILDISA